MRGCVSLKFLSFGEIQRAIIPTFNYLAMIDHKEKFMHILIG